MKNNNAWNEFIKPIVVLVVICFVITFALAYVYGITNPIIEKNTAAAANEARTELLKDAKGEFTMVADEDNNADQLYVMEEKKVYVTDVYTANNGCGMVVTVASNSYGGILTAMIGIDKDGAVTAVKVTDASDTPGVGTKAQATSHLDQYKGYSEIGNIEVKKDPTIQHVSGASISSEAIHKAVCCALEQYQKMGGVK